MSAPIEVITIEGGVISSRPSLAEQHDVAPLLRFPRRSVGSLHAPPDASIIPTMSMIDRYFIREKDRPAVVGFLTDHENVLALLPEAEQVIRRHFSEDDASIRLYLDDDDPRDHILFMQIQARIDVDDAVDRTFVIDDEWYEDDRPLELVINLAVQ
jgi:hypothetical protein